MVLFLNWKNLNWNLLTEIKTDLSLTAWLYVYFHPAHQILWEHNVCNKTHIKDMTHMLYDMRDGVSHTGARPVRIINMLAPCHRLVLILPTGTLFAPMVQNYEKWTKSLQKGNWQKMLIFLFAPKHQNNLFSHEILIFTSAFHRYIKML